MATKKVQPLDIILGIKGAEKLAALKSSFRELTKTVKQTDVDIDAARKSVNEYAKSANQSEAVVKGQIKAFEGLREQAQMGGKVYRELSDDIATLKSQLNGSTPAIDAQRRSILELASGAEVTAKQLGLAVDKLFALRNETRLDSVAFNALGKDIDGLNGKIASLAEQTKQTAKENRQAAAAVNQTLAKYEASAKSQAAASARREAIVREEVLALSEKKKVTDELIKKENQLTAAIKARRQLSVQEGAREARRRVRAGAQVYTGAVELGPVDALDQRLGDLPNTTAAFSQRLSELQDRLVNTVRGGDQYIQVALRIAQVQREASAATQGLGAALIKDLASGAAVRSQKNLREVIGQLQAEMSELNTETAEGSAKYAENARQVNNLQKELDDIANSYRTVTDMARQATGAQAEYANTRVASNYLRRDIVRAQQAAAADVANAVVQAAAQTPLLLPAAGQTSAPGTGAFMSGLARPEIAEEARLRTSTGERPDQPSRGFPGDVEAIAAQRAFGPQPPGPSGQAYIYAAEARRKEAEAAQAAADAVKNYKAEISKATQANDGSINASNRLRSAIERFRATLPPTSKDFAEYTDQINRLDRESEKVSRRMSRRRMSPMQMTQAAGAVLSGGIFGGPEGFVGGAAGALVGGVGGAFAGAAIGAQVGGIRRTLGEYADYAAQITRLNIALEGIAGSQAQYNRALQAATDVTAQLNVPQEVAIQGMTRLVAAVKGAGGGVAEAEIAFKNINSAIIATGGGAEQVQGAVTALVQIFSKGKVSAEEINQIAERLPGTFNKIAEASGRTGPELTKALQQGTVGLNDLMKFLVSLGDEYGELAEKIAGSSENAGARLQVAFNQMRIEVGNALQPIGAEFQNAFTEFIEDITPTLVEVLPKIGEFALVLGKNLDVLAAAAGGAAAAMGLLALASVKVAIPAGVTGLGVLMLKAAAAAGALKAALAGIALLNPFVLLGAGLAAATVGIVKYYNSQKELNELLDEGKGSTEAIKDKIQEYEDSITKATDKLKGINGEKKATSREASRLKKEVIKLRGELERLQGTYKIRLEYERKGYKFGDKGELTEFTVGNIVYGGPRGARARALRYVDGTPIDGGKGFGETEPTGGGSGSKGPKSQLDKLLADFRSLQRAQNGVLEIEGMRQTQAQQLARATADNNQKLITTTNLNNISLDFAEQQLQIENKLLDDLDKAAGLEIEADRRQAEKNARLEYEIKLSQLLEKSKGAIAFEEQRAAIAAEQRQKALDDEIFGLRDQLGLVTDDERIARFRGQAEEKYGADDPRVGEAVDLFRQQIDPTFLEGIQQAIRSTRDELETLIDPINQVTGAATAIGEAFSKSFMDTITGASTAREGLASFFRNVGNYFLDLAGNIIAKLIEIAVLESLTSVFGGGSAGGSGILSRLFGFKDGGVVKDIQPYAKGGIVDKPTLFRYASGGTGRFGLMGEAGPEAIMPLRRGANGKLGVEASAGVGDIIVNVDASDSAAQGDGRQAQQLGKAIGAAVQAELIKQKRPGGLLS